MDVTRIYEIDKTGLWETVSTYVVTPCDDLRAAFVGIYRRQINS